MYKYDFLKKLFKERKKWSEMSVREKFGYVCSNYIVPGVNLVFIALLVIAIFIGLVIWIVTSNEENPDPESIGLGESMVLISGSILALFILVISFERRCERNFGNFFSPSQWETIKRIFKPWTWFKKGA